MAENSPRHNGNPGPGSPSNTDSKGRPLRSRNSQVHSFVRFLNKTKRYVDVVWINYEGSRVKYKQLGPEEFLDMNTYVGHPWIFRDSKSGDKLVVHLNDVYMPIGCNDDGRPRRKIIMITIPVYSLKERCLQVVRQLLPKQGAVKLDIPRTLLEELQLNADPRNGL